MTTTPQQQLTEGLAQLQLNLSQDQQHTLIEFLQLLSKWNQRINLTAITDPLEMVKLHLLDSLAISPFVIGQQIMDVGSGGGFPGIPLAVLFPEKKFVLIDSVAKKTRFLLQAKAQLQLPNIEVVNQRIESLSPQRYQPDCIISRALGSLPQLLELTWPLRQPHTRWLAMKGTLPQNELAALTLPYQVEPLIIPGVTAERHVIIISNA